MIESEKEYKAIVNRIEELLSNPDNIENSDLKSFIVLNLLYDLVAEYEDFQFLGSHQF
jgi:HTH-type transcriptional regulator/antitoxin HigA